MFLRVIIEHKKSQTRNRHLASEEGDEKKAIDPGTVFADRIPELGSLDYSLTYGVKNTR